MGWRVGPVDDFPPRDIPWAIGVRRECDDNHTPHRMDDPQGLMGNRQPISELQALMEAAPGDTPPPSVDEQAALMAELAAAIEAMPARLRWVFEAAVYRGMSQQQIGDEINVSKTHTRWLMRKAEAWLQDYLTADTAPAVTARLDRLRPVYGPPAP